MPPNTDRDLTDIEKMRIASELADRIHDAQDPEHPLPKATVFATASTAVVHTLTAADFADGNDPLIDILASQDFQTKLRENVERHHRVVRGRSSP